MAAKRDRKAEAERRNARATAQGFTSYGQKYRGEEQGYRNGKGAEYNAAMNVAHGRATSRVVRVEAGSRTVLSADVSDPRAMRELMSAVRKESQRKARKAGR